MKLKFFWIHTVGSLSAEDEMNCFLATHRIIEWEKQFYATSQPGPGWSVCAEWLPGPESAALPKEKLGKVVYKVVLDAEALSIYAALRNWRKEATAKQWVPIYKLAIYDTLPSSA